MFRPTTELGQAFEDKCYKLNKFFQDYDSEVKSTNTEKDLSLEISSFFKSIEDFPERVLSLDFSISVLFEIDQSIMGIYGSRIFTENVFTPLRSLIRDIIALWYRHVLLGRLERTNSAFFSIVGIRSFYESWLESERVGIDESEYDRVLRNIVMLLQNEDKLDMTTRIQLFTMLGNIIVILGIKKEDAERVFLKYSYDLTSRSKPSQMSLAEILLNIYVLYATNVNFQSLANINLETLYKAIRYLSATNDFAEILFKDWKVYWENNYFGKLNEAEENQVNSNIDSLNNILKNPTVKLGIGHSYIEYMKYKKDNIGRALIFKPIPMFIYGAASSGKSSLLLSFCNESQVNTKFTDHNSTLVLGKEFQAFYQNNIENWKSGRMNSTNSQEIYTFWEDLTVDSFQLSDYNGREVQPGQWNPELLKQFFNAKALFFVIDETDFADTSTLRQKAAQFETNLQYWAENNPKVRNIPIALVITKSDLILSESLSNLKETTIIPKNFVPETIEGYFENRFIVQNNVESQYGRLYDCIINHKNNNLDPNLQDVVYSVINNFGTFFKRVFDITYNYQIFITSSKYTPERDNLPTPFGVKEPFYWATSKLEKSFIVETLEIYSQEEAQINKEVVDLEKDIVNLYKVVHDLEDFEKRILETEEKSGFLDMLLKKEKLKDLNRRKSESEQKFNRILKDINYETNTTNKNTIMQSLEAIVKEKKELIGEMQSKKNVLANKLN